MQIIDTHCHLDDERFDPDRIKVLERAQLSGVNSFVVPAVSRAGWDNIARMAESFPVVYPAYGMHPWFCEQHGDGDLVLLSCYLQHAVAIGECGLDFGKGRASEAEQLKWFRAQLELAAEHTLPVIVHAYKSVDRVAHELKTFSGLQGVVHSFSGSRQQADRLMELGLYLGIGGAITWPQSERLRDVVKNMPIERLLLETDAPDQPDRLHHGERNEPAFLIEIAEEIATIRDEEIVGMVETCNHNARGLFGI